MRRTVLKITYGGTYSVIRNDQKKSNQYEIFYTWFGEDGKHRKKLNEYEDFLSCLYDLIDRITKVANTLARGEY